MHELTVKVHFMVGQKVEYNSRVKDEGIVTAIFMQEKEIKYLVIWSDKKDSYHYHYELKYK